MNAAVRSCTTPQTNAHDTTFEVLYPWHPWFGKEVIVDQAMVRREQAVFHCRLASDLAARPREVPQWMFDRAACCVMQAREEPVASVTGLRSLLQLLRSVREDQHFPLLKGDVDETRSTETDLKNATGSVRTSPRGSSVESSVSEHASDDQETTGCLDPSTRHSA